MEDHHHKREMREHELTESIERLQISIEENLRKKEENLKGVIQERTLRLKERNDELQTHVYSFKMERSRKYE